MSERISDLGGEPSDLDLGLEGGGGVGGAGSAPLSKSAPVRGAHIPLMKI